MDSFSEVVKEILEKVCGTDEMLEEPDLDLFEEGFLDSFSVLNIILEIEAKLGVRLQPTDISKDDIRTVNKMTEFVNSLREM